MDNNLSGGYITNDNTLSGIVNITADSITATTITTDSITATNGYYTNLYANNFSIVGGDGALGEAKWGSYWSLQTQTNPSANTANFMTFNNYDASNNGTHLKSGSTSEIQVDISGAYNIQFSAQTNITQGNNGTIYIWLRVNGVDIAASTGKELITNNNGQIIAWNYIITLNAGDYIQLFWLSSDIHMQLLYEPLTTSPAKPAVPSIILTIQAVATNIKGETGPQGPQGERGPRGRQAESTIAAEIAAASAAASATAAAGSAAAAAAAAALAAEEGAIAGAEAGTAAAEAVVAELEARVSVLEGKTVYQSAYAEIDLTQHTEFDGKLDVMTQDGFKRIEMDGTSAGKITVGATDVASRTTVEPAAISSQSVYASYVDAPDTFTPINIGYSSPVINIGNPFTAGLGTPMINLYGQINFDLNEVVGIIRQF